MPLCCAGGRRGLVDSWVGGGAGDCWREGEGRWKERERMERRGDEEGMVGRREIGNLTPLHALAAMVRLTARVRKFLRYLLKSDWFL